MLFLIQDLYPWFFYFAHYGAWYDCVGYKVGLRPTLLYTRPTAFYYDSSYPLHKTEIGISVVEIKICIFKLFIFKHLINIAALSFESVRSQDVYKW